MFTYIEQRLLVFFKLFGSIACLFTCSFSSAFLPLDAFDKKHDITKMITGHEDVIRAVVLETKLITPAQYHKHGDLTPSFVHY